MGISSLRDLLSGSVGGRFGMLKSVNASMIVEAANKMLPTYLPGDRRNDATAVSFKNGILRIQLRSSAARYSFKGHEEDLLKKLGEEFPGSSITKVSTFISKNPIRYEFS
ncbi:MAG: hypothetical protein HQ488_05505 [Parcubacteria group bacterium]|nr:hypothetical protein [Parcubacteria group bacterium]